MEMVEKSTRYNHLSGEGNSHVGSYSTSVVIGAVVTALLSVVGVILGSVAVARTNNATSTSSSPGVSFGELVNNYNAMMMYWVQGEEVKYKALVSPSVTMFIPRFSVNRTGIESVWEFRQQIAQSQHIAPNEPLPWINTHDTHNVIAGTTQSAAYILRAFMKSFSKTTGNLTQLGYWEVQMDVNGIITSLYQDVYWVPPSG